MQTLLPQSHSCPAMVNSIVFSNFPLGCISFKLFAGKVPKTAENFCALSTGEKQFSYKGFCCHRIISGFMCQGSDFTCHNCMGGMSIYREKNDDENFIPKHTESCPWHLLDPTKVVPSFLSALP